MIVSMTTVQTDGPAQHSNLSIKSLQFLTKQTAALKEVNESRVRIYEQIEISLSELEQNNLRLNEDSAAEKSKIKRFIR